MTYQLKIVFALLFIYLFKVLLKTNRAKKKYVQERPDEALNAWNIYYLFLYAKVLLKVKAYFI